MLGASERGELPRSSVPIKGIKAIERGRVGHARVAGDANNGYNISAVPGRGSRQEARRFRNVGGANVQNNIIDPLPAAPGGHIGRGVESVSVG